MDRRAVSILRGGEVVWLRRKSGGRSEEDDATPHKTKRCKEEEGLVRDETSLRRIWSEEEGSGRGRGVSEASPLKDDEDALWSTRYRTRLRIATKKLTDDHR